MLHFITPDVTVRRLVTDLPDLIPVDDEIRWEDSGRMPTVDRRTFIYRIDEGDVIDYVNEDWLAFAGENDAGELVHPGVIGVSLWQFITGVETRHLYQVILAKVRSQKVEVSVPYRCDSPELRRYMRMEIVPVGNWIEFQCRVLRLEERTSVSLINRDTQRSSEIIMACSWCKRIATPEWLEAEEAVSRLRLFEQEHMPKISHGICGDCQTEMTRLL